MTGIYKITNKVNGKCYIGQSVDIERRWKHEKQRAFCPTDGSYNYPLSRAFRKYGIENFKFDVIEECNRQELNEKEVYWISYFNAVETGYNQTFGGDSPIKQNKEKILGIVDDLINTQMTHHEIASKWNISTEMVQGINTGRYWKQDYNYPLQKITRSEKNQCRIRVVMPTKDRLQRALVESDYKVSAVAKTFNVSEKTVRAWIKKHDIYVDKERKNTEILELFAKGKSPFEIATQRNLSVSRVRSILNNFGITLGAGAPQAVVMCEKSNRSHELMQFESLEAAVRYINITNPRANTPHIVDVCKGKRKSAYGFYWKYKEK